MTPKVLSPTSPSRLDRRRFLAGGAAFAAGSSRPAAAADFRYRRGISLYHMMREPDRLPNGKFPLEVYLDKMHQMSDGEIARLRAAGFDFVRLAITPDIFQILTGDDLKSAHDIVLRAIGRFLEAGLDVVADLHPVIGDNAGFGWADIVADINAPAFTRYLEMVKRFASLLRDQPRNRVALELMNEPQLAGFFGRMKWQGMLEKLHAAARSEAPDLLLFLTGTQGSVSGLQALDTTAFRNSNVAYTCHYYELHDFTHQGNRPDRLWTVGLPWPSRTGDVGATLNRVNQLIDQAKTLRPDEKAKIKAKADETVRAYFSAGSGPQDIISTFDGVSSWARRNRVPSQRILVSEFGTTRTVGAYSGALEDDRLRWLRAVRISAEAHGFGWALWAYSGPASMTLANEYPAKTLDGATLSALGLRPN